MASRVTAARIATIAVFAFHGMALAQYFVRIPDVKAQAGLDDGQLGLALLGSAVGSVATMPIAGALTNRFGSQRVTAAFAVAFCLLFPLPGFSTSQATLFGSLVLFGMAVGGIDVAFNSQASLVEKMHGRPLMSGFHGSWSVSNLIGAVVATPLVAIGVIVAGHMVIVGVLAGLAILVATRWFVPDPPRITTVAVASPRSVSLPLLAIGTIAGLALLVEGAVADWSGIYLRDIIQAPPASAGVAFGAFSLTMAIARLLGDRVAARFEPRLLVLLGGVVSALGLGLAVTTPSMMVTIGGFAICGIGIGATFPFALSIASRLPGQTAGSAIATVATMGYAGFLAGPPLIGTVSHATSLAVGLGIAIGASCLLSALTWVIPRGRVAWDS